MLWWRSRRRFREYCLVVKKVIHPGGQQFSKAPAGPLLLCVLSSWLVGRGAEFGVSTLDFHPKARFSLVLHPSVCRLVFTRN